MIDFHCHILPAIDDGAVSIDESIAMAKALSEFGYKTVCVTPHKIKGYYELTPEKVKEATLMLQADLDNADIHLELWPGMEYMLDEYFSDYVDDLLPLGETKLVLCEAPPQAHPVYVQEGLKLIVEKGFAPLIAHPERTQYFYEMLSQGDGEHGTGDEEGPNEPKSFFRKFWPFASHVPRHISQASNVSRASFPEGCVFLANLGSFAGYYGPQVQACAYELLRIHAYTGIASDLHDCASAGSVLQRGKFEFNPLLKKLSEWDGKVSLTADVEMARSEEQIGLF